MPSASVTTKTVVVADDTAFVRERFRSALETAGTIIWATVKQRHVPGHLLGRVSSLDWLISIGLLPLSFALTGPAAAAFGAQTTLVAAGLLGSIVTGAALLVPGMRAVEGTDPALAEHALPRRAERVELLVGEAAQEQLAHAREVGLARGL